MSAESRLRLLADASVILAAALNIDDALRQLAHAIVPDFADWCTVIVIGENGVARRVAALHADPAKATLIDEYLRAFEPDRDRTETMLRALRDGTSYFSPTVAPGQLAASAINGDHLRILEGLGCTGAIVAPMIARGAVVGALSMQMSTLDRAFGDDDHQLARDIAGRAGLAIDSARRFAAERAARERAERAERAKDEFLAMLGHELRNPLAPIVTAIELMNRAGGPFQWERQVISRQTRHLSRLVDDLLDISRIARGKVPLAHDLVETGDVVIASIEMAEQLFDRGGQRLHVEVGEGLDVVGDRTRIVQVVANVLINAAKFTSAGGEIRVTAERVADDVVIRVRDTGIGIAPETLPYVFEMFVQGPQSIARTHGGLGLGLTIAKSLVEAHGGAMSAHSDGVGRGAEMTIRLPLAGTSRALALSDEPGTRNEQRVAIAVASSDDVGAKVAAVLVGDEPAPPVPVAVAVEDPVALGDDVTALLASAVEVMPTAAYAGASSSSSSAGSVSGSTTARRVLVVDDNEDAAVLIAASLEVDGFIVRTASDGQMALDVATEHRPEVAILDIGLPILDGYELARRFRANPALAGMCLIALTGYGQASDRRRAMDAGFDHHLVKPVTIAALRAILDAL